MKGPLVGKKSNPALAPTIGEALSAAKNSAMIKRIFILFSVFMLSFFFAGTEFFPGAYPLGLAFLSASSGVLASLASLIGAMFGSARITSVRAIYILVYILLAVTRVGISFWLDADKRHEGNPLSQAFAEARTRYKQSGNLKDLSRGLFIALKSCTGAILCENIRVRIALSACAALFAGAWSVIDGGYVYYDLFGAIFSLFIVPLFTYLFYAATSRNMRASRLREIGIYFLCAAVALSLHSISSVPLSADPTLADAGIVRSGFTFDFGALAAFAATAVITIEYGIHKGVLCGLLCGAVLTPVYAPAFALGAVACGFLSAVSPTLALLVGGAVSMAWGIYVGGLDGTVLLLPPIVGACTFLVPAYKLDLIHLPDGLFLTDSPGRKQTARTAMSAMSSGDIARRVENLSSGLSSVASVLEGLSEKLVKPEPGEMREIVESVFAFHCAKCKNRGICREAKSPETSPAIKKMTENLGKFGMVSADAVPPALASECWNMGRILDEINLTAGHKLAARADGDKLAVTAADYTLASAMLDSAAKAGGSVGKINIPLTEKLRPLISGTDFSASSLTVYGDRFMHVFAEDVDINSSKMGADDIRAMFEEAAGCAFSSPEFSIDGEVLSMRMRSSPVFSCRSGSFSRSASDTVSESESGVTIEVCDTLPDSVCGDVITSFESDGRYYMILSDGMGTGKEAALTSGIVTSLLERLIKSGADLECSLRMMNHIVRGAGRECSATVDIAEIDMISGQARFIKSGAAPSFVIRDGSIFRLQSKTVPIGIIRALDAEMIKFDILPGDTVVMVSDGAARSYDEAPWLLDLMTYDTEITGGDETRAAAKIVLEAKKRGAEDDVSAGIVRISGRAS